VATSRSSVEAMALRETADRPRLPPHRLAQLRLQSKRMAPVDDPADLVVNADSRRGRAGNV
jgi:hypothetical protein